LLLIRRGGALRWLGGALGVALVFACKGSSGEGGAGGRGASTGNPSSGTGVVGCKQLPYVGDPASPIEMTLIARGPEATTTDLTNGSAMPMVLPPQGGRVIFAGVRAKNLDPCNVEILGSLRDKTTKQVRIDERTVNLQIGSDGLAESVPGDISNFANVPTCPNQWASTDIQGNTFELTVTLTDRSGKNASVTLDVVPFCSEPDNETECLCKCKQGYILGQTCP
jgi:hypothetical protein